MVTLALPDRDPVTEGEVAMIHIVVSELRNSYQWRPSARGISVNLDYRWRRRGSGLVSSSRLGVVPLVFMVDHGTGGHRDYRVWLTDFAADHGPLTLTVLPGEGYRVGSAATARTMRKAIASNNVLLPLALGPTRMWKRPSSTSTYRKHR